MVVVDWFEVTAFGDLGPRFIEKWSGRLLEHWTFWDEIDW